MMLPYVQSKAAWRAGGDESRIGAPLDQHAVQRRQTASGAILITGELQIWTVLQLTDSH
jgi:hypothetical protein